MKKVYASEVSRQLGDAGYESSRSNPNARGFRSKQEGDAAHVRFYGRVEDERSELSNYSKVLLNLGYMASTIHDEERGGRLLIQVNRA